MTTWVTTTQILKTVPYCRHSLYALINDGTLKHGYHYLDKRKPKAKRPTYVFSPEKMSEFITETPEKRA